MPKVLLGVLLVLLTACSSIPVTTVYVVRHAEKLSGTDADISAAGKLRALSLMRAMVGVELTAIYASEFKRTQQTVQPTADWHHIPVQRYEATRGKQLSEKLQQQYIGQSVLVAGHSNTVPEILAALGIPGIADLGENQFGDLFVVRIEQGKAELSQMRFDP